MSIVHIFSKIITQPMQVQLNLDVLFFFQLYPNHNCYWKLLVYVTFQTDP